MMDTHTDFVSWVVSQHRGRFLFRATPDPPPPLTASDAQASAPSYMAGSHRSSCARGNQLRRDFTYVRSHCQCFPVL